MKKTHIIALPLLALLLSGLLQGVVLAASASVYPSPSKTSITKGNTFNVQVRVNSGSDPMNAAEARLNFDGSKVQYSSYSVSGSPFDVGVSPTITGSSFKISRARTGGSITSDRLLVTVTFKAKATGTAGFSIDQAVVADSGEAFDSISTGSASVKISNPPSSGSGGSGGGDGSSTDSGFGSTTDSTGSQTTEEKPEPEFAKGPETAATQSTIVVTFETDKPTTAEVSYGIDDRDQSLASDHRETSHEIVIGQDQPLIPGTEYSLQVVITDEGEQSVKSKVMTVRTQGVVYRLVIVDKNGRPLANHPVELHSDPVKAVTDSDGMATFEDVTPGEHTLVFTIDGLTFRQPVQVGVPLISADEASEEVADEQVVLPFSFAADDAAAEPVGMDWRIITAAAAIGALIAGVTPRAIHHWPAPAQAKIALMHRILRESTANMKRRVKKHLSIHPRTP